MTGAFSFPPSDGGSTARDGGPEDALVPNLVGRSPAFLALVAQIRRFAQADAPVLIEGETGCGKELAARAIHYLGARRDRAFVPLNCGAIPDSLIESELFGHARGAFTDAKLSRAGVVAQADQGTLFLDEIDSLSIKGQVTMLRFLQDRRYRPVGNSTEQHCDARVVAATNRALSQQVALGSFRSDLLYRLNILVLRIPPLRERGDDIDLLASHYLRLYCASYRRPLKRLHPATCDWMRRQSWPGNVRELENLIHRLVLVSDSDEIAYVGEEAGATPAAASRYPDFHSAKACAVAEFERGYLSRLLSQTGGNVAAAARLACTERRSLGRLLKKHGIDKSRYRDER